MSNDEQDLKLMTNTGRVLAIKKKYTNIYHTNLENSITAA